MYRKLHMKMTLFCGTVTGVILLAMTLAGLIAFERLLEKNDSAVHEKTLNTVLNQLEGESLIDYGKLGQIADMRFYTITLYEKETPYFLYQDPVQQERMKAACGLASAKYGFQVENPPTSRTKTKHLEFVMKEEGVEYLASFSSIPHPYGTFCAVVLYSRAQLHQQIWGLRLFLLAVDLAALLLLFLFAWFYTGRMLGPIEENRKKQIQFVASASHELRSPLSVILSSADALTVAEEEDRNSFHEMIRSEGRRMSQLINDMLALANSDTQTWSMYLEPVALDSILPDLYEKYQPLAGKNGLKLLVDLPDSDAVPFALCDRQRIEQVMEILLDNAVSYTQKGGSITLGLSQDGTKWRLWVKDTGPGVPDQWKEQIFGRFFRADPSRKDKKHFGLGLSIAQEIVRLHKGKIWVEDRPGGGAVFCVQLPRAEAADE